MKRASKEPVWTIGLGASTVPDCEGFEACTAGPIRLVKVIDPSRWFVELTGNTLKANPLPSHMWRLGSMARFRAN